MNHFLLDVDEYQRDIDPIKAYIHQSAQYLATMSGDRYEDCAEWIRARMAARQMPGMHNPVVRYFERGDNLDRAPTSCRLSEYIQTVTANREILAPTFTSYVHPDERRSLIVDFLDHNVAVRSIAKKEQFKAKAAKDMVRYTMKENEQENAKRFNNSCSGAFGADGNPLNNPTAHNTLTSIVRCESSVSNASNEKVLAGNRHYYTPLVTLNNIISISSQFDATAMAAMIRKYQLVYPTVEDTMACIEHSTDFYWRDTRAMNDIYQYVRRCTDVQLAAIVYIGDLYHVRKLNDAFVRSMLAELSYKPDLSDLNDVIPAELLAITDDPYEYLSQADEQIINVAHQICMSESAGFGKDYRSMPISSVWTIVSVVHEFQRTLSTYRDFIRAIFLTLNVPASTAYIRSMLRRVVLVSDTDSTMFTVDEWVNWYFGSVLFTPAAFAVAASVTYMATQCIAHSLAIFSANLGVERPRLFMIAMKPEFAFPIFAQTSLAKHYYTYIQVREGNVYDELELEVKGVGLKSSAVPKSLIELLHARMRRTLDAIYAGRQISIIEEITWLADIERSILNSLHAGETTYYGQSKIKTPESYRKGPDESIYMHHRLWSAVMEPKYGPLTTPPYNVIKIPTIVTNITGLNRWLAGISDEALRGRLTAWLDGRGKRQLPTLYLSIDYVSAYGIPPEYMLILDARRIVLDLTKGHRNYLESLGYFPKLGRMITELTTH